MDINFKILQSKYYIIVIKIFALKNFKINIHQNVSRAFNILHYNIFIALFSSCVACFRLAEFPAVLGFQPVVRQSGGGLHQPQGVHAHYGGDALQGSC